MPGRVLLDADVPLAVAEALTRFGHDVVPGSGNPNLEALADPELLREATRQGRVLVTFNVSDFLKIAHDFAHVGEDHAGIVLIHSRSFARTDVGAIAKSLDTLLRTRPDPTNAILFLQ